MFIHKNFLYNTLHIIQKIILALSTKQTINSFLKYLMLLHKQLTLKLTLFLRPLQPFRLSIQLRTKGPGVQGSPGETWPCRLIVSCACKIRLGCNVLQVIFQIMTPQSEEAIPSVADQKCDIISPVHH